MSSDTTRHSLRYSAAEPGFAGLCACMHDRGIEVGLSMQDEEDVAGKAPGLGSSGIGCTASGPVFGISDSRYCPHVVAELGA